MFSYGSNDIMSIKLSCKIIRIHSFFLSWDGVLAGIRHSEEIIDRIGWDQVPSDSVRLSVMMWGMDSISRNNFIRKLPRTYSLLTKILGAVVLEGYNIVGDGTPQALIPILTGKSSKVDQSCLF